MSGIRIRTANIEDIDAISRLGDEINDDHHAAVPHVFAQPPGLERDRDFWIASINAEAAVMLVAVEGDEILGFITAAVSENLSLPFIQVRKICRVGTIVVARNSRNKGVGKLLFHAMEDWAKSVAAVEIRLEVFAFNESAIAFYERQDFGFQSHIMSKAVI